MSARYEEDAYGWANEQAALLRAGRFSEADVENLIEELEDMGQSKQRELESRLIVILHHLLKWKFQPEYRGKSWRNTIREQRRRIARLIVKNPSLKPEILKIIADAYLDGRASAADETDLNETIFPVSCPWTWEQIMDPEFWPE